MKTRVFGPVSHAHTSTAELFKNSYEKRPDRDGMAMRSHLEGLRRTPVE